MTAWRFKTPIFDKLCRVVFAGPHFQQSLPNTRALLEARGLTNRVELIHAVTNEELLHWAPVADIALPFMQKFDKKFLQSATNLRLVQQYGVGLEGVDMKCATQLGIAVCNIPADGTGNAQATAEHALFLAISLLRYVHTDLPRRFRGRELGGLPVPRTLFRKNVTVVGYGAVGSTLCQFLTTMGAKVTAVRRKWPCSNPDPTVAVKATSLLDVLRTTQVLFLACALTTETLNLINKETISFLPKGALIINVGRGPLVEYDAILNALNSEQIGGFASDVGVGHPAKPSEPWDPDDLLSNHQKAYFTPHIGGYSDYTWCAMAETVVDNIERLINCQAPKNWKNFRCNE